MARNLLPLAGVVIVLVFLLVWRDRMAGRSVSPEADDPSTAASGAPSNDGPGAPGRAFEDPPAENPANDAIADAPARAATEGAPRPDAEPDGPPPREGDDGLGAPDDPRRFEERDGRRGRDGESGRDARDAFIGDWMKRVRAHAAEAERVAARVAAGEAWRAEDYNDRAEELAAELALELGAEPADAYLSRVPLYKIDIATGKRFRVDVAGRPIDG